MGSISQLFWFLNMEELPPKRERDSIFTHLDVELESVKRLRREYRRNLKLEEKQGEGKE